MDARKPCVKPALLKPGATVGVVAPAGPLPTEQVQRAAEVLASFGFQVRLGQSVTQQYGYLAGDDEARADDLNRMFADEEIQAIFCLRGGYGSPRILDRLDYGLIGKNPKIFIGYSDVTALHLAIHKQTGLVTFHGPMLYELAGSYDEASWSFLLDLLRTPERGFRYGSAPDEQPVAFTGGTAEGVLVGGNLTLVSSTLSTPFEVETAGKILFLEDVGEEPYRLDRMLTHLRLAGKLQAAAGIVLTDFAQCQAAKPEMSLTACQVAKDILAPLGIPAYYGLQAGHCRPNFTLPIGVRARLNADEHRLDVLEGSVRPIG